jgi:hypothetical protein
MSLNPPFRQLFPRSMLLVCVDDDASCSVVFKSALLVGWWHRIGWPFAFLRRGPAGLADAPKKFARTLSGAGDVIIDLADSCSWRDQQLRELVSDFSTASLTLAGSGLHDVLLGAALAANAASIPVIVVADAVQGRPRANFRRGQSDEAHLSLLKQFALLLPMAAFMSAVEPEV